MIAALEKIAADLAAELEQHRLHHEPVNPEVVRLAVRRIRAQLEMVTEGLTE